MPVAAGEPPVEPGDERAHPAAAPRPVYNEVMNPHVEYPAMPKLDTRHTHRVRRAGSGDAGRQLGIAGGWDRERERENGENRGPWQSTAHDR